MTPRIRKLFGSNIALAGTVAFLAACWTSQVSALDLPSLSGSYYGGVGYGVSEVEPRVNESGYTVTDSQSSGVNLFLGRDFSARISLEGHYTNLGAASLSREDSSGRIDYSTFSASGLFYLLGGGGVDSLANRQGLNIYARLGGGRLNNEGRGIEFRRLNDWYWSAGLGAEYNLKNGFGLRAEFHNFDSDARVVTLNVVKRFRVEKRKGKFPLITERPNTPLPISSKDEDAKKQSELAGDDSDGDGVFDSVDACDDTKEGATVDANGCDFNGVVEGVTFASGSADLTEESSDALDRVIATLKKNTDVAISIQAHTDNRGTAEKNMALSFERAETVVRYLVESGKIDLGRLSAIGYGESRPRKSNDTQEGRLENRRVEIKVAE